VQCAAYHVGFFRILEHFLVWPISKCRVRGQSRKRTQEIIETEGVNEETKAVDDNTDGVELIQHDNEYSIVTSNEKPSQVEKITSECGGPLAGLRCDTSNLYSTQCPACVQINFISCVRVCVCVCGLSQMLLLISTD